MSTVLLVITIGSLVAAAGAAWFAWRVYRDDEERSHARVAALSNAIDAADPVPLTGPPVAVNSLFAPEHSEAARGIPVIKAAVGIVMATAIIVFVAMSNRGASSPSNGEPIAAGSALTVSSKAAAPLELISMRHERNGETLTVTGLVRNPRNGRAIRQLTAVVFAFNRSGAFVTSGRAAVDFTTIDAGDESPFVVNIPGVTDIGRYRVSFRTDAGVVRHVDGRGDQTRLASAAVQ
jgi:hypothetical protein